MQIQYGVSRLSKRFAHAYHHFQEAEQVLTFSSHAISPFFDDLGIYRLLMHVEQGHVIDSFIEDYLGDPLLRHDQAHGSQLLLTFALFWINTLSNKKRQSGCSSPVRRCINAWKRSANCSANLTWRRITAFVWSWRCALISGSRKRKDAKKRPTDRQSGV